MSVGGLLPGLELDDLMMGVSVCRNPRLASVFYRLQLIEAYGTGVKKIMKAYESSPAQPRIETTHNAFKITLPNVNAMRESEEAPAAIEGGASPVIGRHEEKIIRFLAEHPTITRLEVQELLGVGQSTAGRILKAMVDDGQIASLGDGRATRYKLA